MWAAIPTSTVVHTGDIHPLLSPSHSRWAPTGLARLSPGRVDIPLAEALSVLRSARADYDTVTIRLEVNGLVEPLTDPHVRLHIYADAVLTETKYW